MCPFFLSFFFFFLNKLTQFPEVFMKYLQHDLGQNTTGIQYYSTLFSHTFTPPFIADSIRGSAPLYATTLPQTVPPLRLVLQLCATIQTKQLQHYYHISNTESEQYRTLKKYLPPSRFLFLPFCHTNMFQIIKQILISNKDTLSKYKKQLSLSFHL